MENIRLEAGKPYITHGGQKAYVTTVGLPEDDRHVRALGFIVKGCKHEPHMWHVDGKTYPQEDGVAAEWVEPKKPRRIKGYLNVYSRDGGVIANDESAETISILHLTRESADRQQLKGMRLACVEIDVIEGQGLDGGA